MLCAGARPGPQAPAGGGLSPLEEAFTGHFTDHHAVLLQRMLAHIDAINADIAALEAKVEEMVLPFAQAIQRLDEIPGVGPIAAAVIVAEVGLDMAPVPHRGAPGGLGAFRTRVKESAGKKKGNAATGHGNRYLARILGEAAVGAARTNTFLGERYRRIAKRRGKKKALVAVGRSILVIIWHLLSNPDATYRDLGPGFYDTRVSDDRKKRNHIHQLEALGYRVTLEPAA